MSDLHELFGEPIFSYTRAEAIADGVLIDITETMQEVGFKFPAVITSAAHARYVAVPSELEGWQDESGRLWDICWMLKASISGKAMCSEIDFPFLCMMPDKGDWLANEQIGPDGREVRMVTLRCQVHPGDDGEGVMTIMMPNED